MKKTLWRRILLVLLIAAMTAVVIAANKYHKTLQIRNIQVQIDYNKTDTLLVNKEIEESIYAAFGDLKGSTINEIDFKNIEKTLSKNPFISKADVYADLKGVLHAGIKQRKPVIRICDRNGNQFYIDNEGYKIPLSSKGTQNVIIASGYINVDKNKQNPIISVNIEEILKSNIDLERIYYLADYIRSHPFFKNQIDQIYLTKGGDLELIPKLGSQVIIFGGIDRMQEKLENLLYLYKDGFSNVGWDLYKTINLKFENQIVCTKY